MGSQTVTRATESDLEPGRIYAFLAEAGNIPKWAPVFADAIERVGDGQYRVTKNGATFNIEVSLHPAAGTVDYIREMPNGRRGGAYLRVMPRPLGGCTITMTVPIGPGTSESDVAKVLEQELADVVQLARG
jgi:Polyketide cyclase / dehydrase and lipid transport